jgi:hypothetical protein
MPVIIIPSSVTSVVNTSITIVIIAISQLIVPGPVIVEIKAVITAAGLTRGQIILKL